MCQKKVDNQVLSGYEYKIQGVTPMKEYIILAIVIGIWILLQAYILPKLGIST
jgi:hypothetical protein